MIPDKPLWFLITPSAGSSFVVILLYLIVIYIVFYESVEINEIEIENMRAAILDCNACLHYNPRWRPACFASSLRPIFFLPILITGARV